MSDYLPLPPLPPPSSRPTSSLPWTTAPASKLLPLLLSQSLIPHPQGAPRDQTSHIPHTVHIFPSASQCLLIKSRGFPGSPLVKSLYSHCRGHRFDPWQKTKTSQVKKQSHTHKKKKSKLLSWLGHSLHHLLPAPGCPSLNYQIDAANKTCSIHFYVSLSGIFFLLLAWLSSSHHSGLRSLPSPSYLP